MKWLPKASTPLWRLPREASFPAAFLQQELEIPLSIVRINYRDRENKPRFDDARLLDDTRCPYRGKKILLVDDVSRTGQETAENRDPLPLEA